MSPSDTFTPPGIDTGGLDALADNALPSSMGGFRSATGEIRLHIPSDYAAFDVRGMDKCAIRVQSLDAAWPTAAVVTIQISTNGIDWSGFTSPQTLNASGGVVELSTTGVSFLRAAVTTKTSDAGYYRAAVYFNATSTN